MSAPASHANKYRRETRIDEWESAWAAYVEAEDIFQCCRQLRYSVGHMRAWKSACVRRRKCIKTLRKLDAEFCDRMGIN